RNTAQIDAATGEVRRTRYNAFGEIAGKGLGDGWQEFIEYNTLGKVQKSNTGDGVTRIFLYDRAGNATRRIESATVDLTGVSVVAAAHDATLLHTFSSHDRRGHLVKTVEPDISYLRDQVSMSQAFTQQLADLYGPLSVGHSAGGTYAGGTVDAASFSYTQVSGTDNVESMPSPATPATGVARRYEAPPPLRMAASPAGAASFPLAWGGSTSFLSKARTRTIQLLIPADFPALAYRVTDATGTVALSGPLAPGQSYLVAGQGTFLLQVQLGAGYYYTISTLQTQTSAEPMLNSTYQVEQTWSSTEPPGIWIPPADGAGPFGATVGEATATSLALPVEDPGGGWVFVNAAGLPAGTHQLTLRASDAAGNAVGEVLTVTLGDGARITGRTALADPDVRVAGADGRVLWFQRAGIGGTEGVLHIRTAGSTADWRAFTFGGSNADSTPFGLQPGVAYEFIVATSTKETYGQLTIGDDGVPVIANGGMLQAVSRWPQTLDFDLAGRLSDPSAPAYVMELRIGSILVTKALAEARVSFDVATDLAALGVTDHANRRFDYDYRVYGLRGTLRQFVGQGSGTVQLGSDFAAWPTVGTFARKPLALITLPAGASLAGALSVQPQGTPTAIAIASGDWRRTSPTSTTLAIDLSQWLVYGALPRLIDIRYSAGDAVFGATYRLLGNGAVECVAFSAAARQPRIPITVSGATRLAVLKVGATDATLAAVATSRWTTSGSTFTWDAADQAGLGARRFYYEATDAAGQLVGKGYGSFALAADGTLTYAMDAPLLRPSSVRFTPPAGTASFELRVRPRGSTGAWTVHASLPVDGTARVLDATSLRPATGTAEYECSYVAKDAAGLTVGSGSGLLAIASNGATSATLAEDRKPTVVTLHGPKGKSVPRLQLETRPDGSTGPTITVVLAGTWNAELDCTVFTWQTDVPSAVQYDYTLRMQNADGTAYRNEVGDPIEVRGVMTLSPGATSPVVMQQYVTRLAQSAQVKRLQDYNAFGEVAAEYDDRVRQRAEQMVSRYGGTANAAAVKTIFTYNALGQLLARTDPETHVTHANGARARVRPETRYGYDLTGRLATVTDANGHQGRQAYAGAGDALGAQWAADGGRKAWAYDAFGALRQTTDELGAVTRQDTDKLGNVVRVERLGIARVENFTDPRAVPSTLVDTYAHDAFGRRIRHTNALGFVDKTFYDSLGRVTRTVSAENRATRYDYAFVEAGAADGILGAGGRNVGGHRVTSTGSDGRATVDKTDYFGRTTWHQDLGGHSYTYRYDIGGRLAAQTSSAGQNIAYAHYANGYIKEAKDLAEHTLSRYGYDNAGNRTWEAYSALDAGGTMPVASYQESTLAYDELNRLSHVKDLAVDLQYEYDAVGNRRAVHAVYWDPLTLGTRRRDDLWYAYDSANRFTLTKGAFSGTRGAGRIVKGTDGVEITYDLAGQRLSATDAAGHVESYRYSADGYLEDVRIDGALRARRRVDAAGRTLQYKEWAADGTQRLDKSTTYDRDNRVLKEVTGDGTTEYFYFTSAADDAATAAATGSGALARVRLTPSTGDTTVTTTYGYQYWDSARQATIRKQAVNEAVPDWAAGFSQFHYDVNGYLKFAHDLAGGRSMRYFTNATGLVLRREEWKGAQSYSHHWYYAGGRRVGDVSTDPTADFRISYAETLAQQEAADVRPPAGMTGFMAAVAQKAADMVNRRTADERDRFKNFRPVTSADFDQNYEPITPSYPAAAGGTYTVRSGDTLKSIAQALWGDSAMWFLIAQSNDLSGSETLAAGQVLVVPNKVTNIHNDAQTFRPYSPGEAIGHVDPTLPTP
ncbi:MAG TPA: LysM peptidoglycan-binding domain-containing protein, partial [Albitalea sp.]